MRWCAEGLTHTGLMCRWGSFTYHCLRRSSVDLGICVWVTAHEADERRSKLFRRAGLASAALESGLDHLRPLRAGDAALVVCGDVEEGGGVAGELEDKAALVLLDEGNEPFRKRADGRAVDCERGDETRARWVWEVESSICMA
jgi:hypothetical protein